MGIYEKLSKVQSTLKAPKGQYNSFGKYKYRSCEDILEAVKPLLADNKLSLQLYDELVCIGESTPSTYEETYYDKDLKRENTRIVVTGNQRYYIKATAKLLDIEDNSTLENTAYAREDEVKKGMDGSQITGTASSYARKYALNGLFLIDDVKDSDSTNTGENEPKKEEKGSQRVVLLNRVNELELELDIPHEKTLEVYKVTSNNQMTDSQLQDCIKRMEAKLKEKESK